LRQKPGTLPKKTVLTTNCALYTVTRCHVLPGQEIKKKKKLLSLIITELEGKKLQHFKED
jgi:hypothetical protein